MDCGIFELKIYTNLFLSHNILISRLNNFFFEIIVSFISLELLITNSIYVTMIKTL